MSQVPLKPGATMAAQGGQVRPGRVVDVCPPPTEIVCIDVPKVYDFCFQQHNLGMVCNDLPDCCPRNAVSAYCTITGVNCTELARAALENGFANVTLQVTVFRTITVLDASGSVACTFDDETTFFKTVTLCAPPGTSIDCFSSGSSCGPCFIHNGQVCCSVVVCLLVEATAVVKLLVPSFGFCVPSECEELAPPPECPPEELFPEQCVSPT